MDNPQKPDHGSSLVWSTEDSRKVAALLKKHGGDVNKSLKALFGDSCSYKTALQLAAVLARHFGLSQADFMKKYLAWRKGDL